MIVGQCNVRSFSKTLNLRNFAPSAWRRDLANGEMLDNKSPSPECRCALRSFDVVARTVGNSRALVNDTGGACDRK